jgi:hypothetical protein
VTLLTSRTTAQPQATEAPRPRWAGLRTWLLERGVLWGLIQTPLLAILGGVFYHLAPYPFLLTPMLASFVALPIWISWRKRVSTNPDEPVHHLHRYALWALPPAAMFSVSRIPLHYTIGIIYWHPWYDFGNALTGTPLDAQNTLAIGGLLNLIQGWAMGLGFYILFKRHSLMNVLLYIAVWVSSLYSYTFGDFSRVGLKSPPYWHASMAWAHWWMALTLWFMPVLYARWWPRWRAGKRITAVGVGVLVVLLPSVFAQWRAVTWQYPREKAIDQAAFTHPNLVTIKGNPALVATSADASYRFTLQFGPRDYHNWFKQLRTLDAGSIQVTGRIWHNNQIIAWCNANINQLPSANGATVPANFAATVQAMKFTDIPVTCTGPAAAATGLAGSQVTVQWDAQMTLIGGQLQQTRHFTGTRQAPLST